MKALDKLRKKERLMENIYDLIKVITLNDKQDDEWATLSRQHAKEAKKELKIYLKDKNIEWNGNKINIGRDITISIKL